jgi:uncharacterized protein YrrD
MEFRENARVYGSDDRDVGRIDRVVIDPVSSEVTHLVVRKGFLFKVDKVIPIGLVETARVGGVRLKKPVDEMKSLPDFIETHYVPAAPGERGDPSVPESTRALYWYPPISIALGEKMDIYSHAPLKLKEHNIPGFTVALREGAKVFGSDERYIGDVERVYTEPGSDRISHFLVSRGIILKEKKLVPARWARVILEDEVRLAVPSPVLAALPDREEK